MPLTLTEPSAAAAPPPPANTAPPKSGPIAAGFIALASDLAQAAIDATDAGDEAGFARAMAYRAALRRMAERWAAGEASPTRSSTKKGD